MPLTQSDALPMPCTDREAADVAECEQVSVIFFFRKNRHCVEQCNLSVKPDVFRSALIRNFFASRKKMCAAYSNAICR
jgi:hypothetical protein